MKKSYCWENYSLRDLEVGGKESRRLRQRIIWASTTRSIERAAKALKKFGDQLNAIGERMQEQWARMN